MNSNNTFLDDEIDLRQLFRVLWEGKKLIILVTTTVAIISVIYALLLTNYYSSESVLSVRDASPGQGLLSQYGGMASMMGVNISTSGDAKAMKAIELIQSRKFVKHLMNFESILPSMMAVDGYDSASKKLLFDQDVYNEDTKEWQSGSKPSYLQAHIVYMRSISISQDQKTGFLSISIEHVSPIFAKDFLELIIREANSLQRTRDLQESSQALRYLKSEFAKTSLVEIRDSISTLIEAQLERPMLAKINEDYILVEIEPPFIPEKRSRPSRTPIVFFSTMLAGLFSVATVLIQHYPIRKK